MISLSSSRMVPKYLLNLIWRCSNFLPTISTTDESVVDIVGRKFEQRQIRLSRYFGTIREDDNDIMKKLKEDAEDAVSRAIEIIRNRVDQYGVSEPSLQRQGSRRIIVELPGIAK